MTSSQPTEDSHPLQNLDSTGQSTPSTIPTDRPRSRSRPRVRFNSNAAQNPVNPAALSNHDLEKGKEPSPPRLPRPVLNRNPTSYNSVVDDAPDLPLSPAKAKSAEDAAKRAQRAAEAARASADHLEKDYDDDDDDDARPWASYDNLEEARPATPKGQTDEDKSQFKHTNDAAALLWDAHRNPSAYQPADSAPSPAPSDHGSVAAADHRSNSHQHPQGGVFYQILQGYRNNAAYVPSISASSTTKVGTPGSSGATTPTRRKWYNQEKENRSQETLSMLVGASRKLANPAGANGELPAPNTLRKRPGHKRTTSGRIVSAADTQQGNEIRIQMQIADILQRQKYITKSCRALMLFGAPGHRLEEYMRTTAAWLEVPSQFLYVPDCMIISFDDNLTHTAKVKIVRETQGVNLAKLKRAQQIYKEVLHDVIPLDEAIERLETLIDAPPEWPKWLHVLMYGLASAAISVFFQAGFLDMPVIFVLGTLLGAGVVYGIPKSRTFAVVFEVLTTTIFAFVARAVGSITDGQGHQIFCFSAITQSSIAMILPGVLVLNSALELQSRAIVPGSIRMVYAIIYSLFLGYGITIGTTLYGYIDPVHAVNDAKCHNPMNPYYGFLFVPCFILFACFTSNARLRQMPLMVGIGFCGYIVNFYTAQRFSASLPIAYALGAFTVGMLANGYSRFFHGVAITVLIPAVFVQVPGSLATSGAITAGLATATALNNNDANSGSSSDNGLNTIVFSLAASMIQISVGLSVGLSMANLVLYPMGKRRSTLWSL